MGGNFVYHNFCDKIGLRGLMTMSPKTLKQARQGRGWTETRAAEHLGVSQSYLAMLENGQRNVTPRMALSFKSVY